MGNSGCNTSSTRVLSISERQTDFIVGEMVQDIPGINKSLPATLQVLYTLWEFSSFWKPATAEGFHNGQQYSS